MSAQNGTDAESEDDGPGRREVAHRVFAAEYDDATRSYQEGDEERAPTYVVTPSGAKANRLFLVGVLTEVEQVNDEMLRARIVDPTGAFVVYAGQYQPEARATFERTSPPEFVAVAGKARTFQPEDGDRVFSSVRPESVNVVDADVRDRWAVETARATLRRVGEMAAALQRGDPGDPTGGVALALDHYGTTPGYLGALRDLATDAAEVVADDRDEVRELDLAPGDDRPGTDLAALAALLDVEDLGGEEAESAAAATGEPASATGDTESTTVGADTGADLGDDGIAEIDASDDVEEFDAGGVEAAEADDGGTDDLGGGDEVGDFDAGDDLGDEDVGEFETDDEIGDFEPGGIGASEDAAGESESEPATEAGDGEMYEMDEEERERIESEYGTDFSTGTEVDEPGEADIDTPDPEELAAEDEDGTEPADDSTETTTTGAEAAEQAEEIEPEIESEETEDEAEPEEADADEEPEEVEETAEEIEETDEGEVEEEIEEADEETDEAEADEAEADEADEEADEAETDEEAEADLDDVLMEQMRELDDGDGADREELVAAVVDATGADDEAVDDAIQDALMSGQCYEPGEDRLKPI